MDFVSITLFLILYYIRPQEWMSFLLVFRPVLAVQVVGLLAMFARDRGIGPQDFFRTPHDWAMAVYLGWLLFFTPPNADGNTPYAFIAYYVLVRQALNSRERIQTYLYWWAGLVLFIATLGLVSLLGIDPTGAVGATEAYRGRLALGSSVFHSPNAFGHSVVPLIPLVYFLVIWKRMLPMKVIGVALIAIGLMCVYLTQSKGAYLSGFVAVIGVMMFGRPKVIQVLTLLTAVSIGWTAMKMLPRMEELRTPRSEEGIAGRIFTLTWGLAAMQSNPSGLGWNNYDYAFAIDAARTGKKPLSPHCSYNAIGSELGYRGLCFYIAVLYCCLRTLIMARTSNVEDERIRRTLFIMVVTYVVSGWMIDFSYRTTFFLIAAAVSAFHLHLVNQSKETQEAVVPQEFAAAEDKLMPVTGGYLQPIPNFATPVSFHPMTSLAHAGTAATGAAATVEEQPKPAIKWYRFGIIDAVLVYFLTEEVIRFWKWLITDF